MIVPPSLKPGDKVGIISPSRKIKRGSLDRAISIFEEWGLSVVTGPNVYAGYHQFGGTDPERAADLQLMLDDPEIKAVMCSRGGYGTVRIIDLIDFGALMACPKWIAGYSDITVLHSHINAVCGIETLHSMMPVELSPDKDPPVSARSVDLLKEALFGTIPAYYQPNHALSRKGRAEGTMTGGNLSVLYSLLGSDSEPDMQGSILFIEDVGEYLYHIDRMMMSLKRSGVLAGIAGLVVGGMSEMNDNEVPFGKTAQEIIAGAVSDYDYPVLFGFPAGHEPENHPLVMGRNAVLSVGDTTSSLVFLK
jgi:muramoyltetrapeptide carboxypeptidase